MRLDNMETGVDYRAIVESVPAIVFMCETGDNGVWRYVNEWIEPILGFTVEEWINTPGIWEQQLHPDDRDWVRAAEAAEVAAAEESLDDPARRPRWNGSSFINYRMIHRHGHVVWIRDSSVLVRADDGVLLWHGLLLDISDQKEIERQLERQSAAQAAVARIGEHALAGRAIQDLLDEACRAATEALGVDAAVASQISDDRATLELRAEHNRAEHGRHAPEQILNRERLHPDTPSSYMLQSGKPLLVQDWEQETRSRASDRIIEQGIRSSIAVRIEGPVNPWGVFRVFSARANAFTEADVNFVVSIANILADAIERQDAEDAMHHRALHDPLTGLPNRVLFIDRLEQTLERSRRHPGSLAVLFIDVDHFKNVNDTLGHQAGDELLIEVAARLREAVRPSDTVARFGGDEFGLLLEEISSERVAIAMAERIAAGFARPFALDAGSQFVTTSIGIAIADGLHDAQAVLRDADAAMYRAKQRGRARYDLFDEDLRIRALARGRMENDLRRAVDLRELRLAYQPVVRLSDETMNGVEALLRWDHPQRGPVSPSEFVQVAEESGLIERVGQWMIEQAFRDAMRWKHARPDLPSLRIGINVSTQQLQDSRFPEFLGDTLQASGIDPSLIYLELDEHVLRDDAEQIRIALRLLKRLGVSLAIHDFGTGDSSLPQLAALPIDTIKVDRRFVTQLGFDESAALIAQAVIATGRALELGVIGAGTETPEQVEHLRRLGCSAVQGLLFSPAVSADEIERFLGDSDSMKRTLP